MQGESESLASIIQEVCITNGLPLLVEPCLDTLKKNLIETVSDLASVSDQQFVHLQIPIKLVNLIRQHLVDREIGSRQTQVETSEAPSTPVQPDSSSLPTLAASATTATPALSFPWGVSPYQITDYMNTFFPNAFQGALFNLQVQKPAHLAPAPMQAGDSSTSPADGSASNPADPSTGNPEDSTGGVVQPQLQQQTLPQLQAQPMVQLPLQLDATALTNAIAAGQVPAAFLPALGVGVGGVPLVSGLLPAAYPRNRRRRSRPKFTKPTSGFNYWFSENRMRIMDMYPSLKTNALTAKMGEMWKEMSEEQKRPWNEKARRFREAYYAANPELKSKAQKRREERGDMVGVGGVGGASSRRGRKRKSEADFDFGDEDDGVDGFEDGDEYDTGLGGDASQTMLAPFGLGSITSAQLAALGGQQIFPQAQAFPNLLLQPFGAQTMLGAPASAIPSIPSVAAAATAPSVTTATGDVSQNYLPVQQDANDLTAQQTMAATEQSGAPALLALSAPDSSHQMMKPESLSIAPPAVDQSSTELPTVVQSAPTAAEVAQPPVEQEQGASESALQQQAQVVQGVQMTPSFSTTPLQAYTVPSLFGQLDPTMAQSVQMQYALAQSQLLSQLQNSGMLGSLGSIPAATQYPMQLMNLYGLMQPGQAAMALSPDGKSERTPRTTRRRVTGYNMYIKTHFAELQAQNPHLEAGEINRMCGEIWKTLTDAQKEHYNNLAQEAANATAATQPQ